MMFSLVFSKPTKSELLGSGFALESETGKGSEGVDPPAEDWVVSC